MIDKASDYIFVEGNDVDEAHPLGDLGRIDIRGELALISLLDPYPIRGEDVTMLLEGCCERLAALQGTEPVHGTYVFSRRITSDQMLRVTSMMEYLCQSRRFVKDESLLEEFSSSQWSQSRTFLYEKFPAAFYDEEFRYPGAEWNELFSRGSPIQGDPIVYLERYMNKLVRYVSSFSTPNFSRSSGYDFLKTRWEDTQNYSPVPFSTDRLHIGGSFVYGRDVYKTYYSDWIGNVYIQNHDIKSTLKSGTIVQSGFYDDYIRGRQSFWVLFRVFYHLKCYGWSGQDDEDVSMYKYAMVHVGEGEKLTAEMINSSVPRAFELAGISDDLSIPEGDPATGRSFEGYCYVEIVSILPISTLRDRTVIV